jgi:hypothetical protein
MLGFKKLEDHTKHIYALWVLALLALATFITVAYYVYAGEQQNLGTRHFGKVVVEDGTDISGGGDDKISKLGDARVTSTNAKGLVLTGKGSTNDLLYQNDNGSGALQDVFSVITGSNDLSVAGSMISGEQIKLTTGTLNLLEGGTSIQAGTKAGPIFMDKPSGKIVMHNTALGASTNAAFVVNNTYVSPSDVVILNMGASGTGGSYTLTVSDVASSVFTVNLYNQTGATLTENIDINYVVIKGASA